ncbi:MAG: biliverdin-producing heme oxygenase [Isosphaeraceae bacterium]
MTTQQTEFPEPLLARLRAETRDEHAALERSVGLEAEPLDVSTYLGWLVRFYGFYEPLERLIAAQLTPEAHGVDPAARRRAPLLAIDLISLGLDPSRVPLCGHLPVVGDPADAFGCMYVLEGSTLGGQFISRRIMRDLGMTPERGGRFFHGHGARTGEMWQAFRDAISAFGADHEQGQIVAAAVATFRSLRDWWEEGPTR